MEIHAAFESVDHDGFLGDQCGYTKLDLRIVSHNEAPVGPKGNET
jgi:hypothetical protein